MSRVWATLLLANALSFGWQKPAGKQSEQPKQEQKEQAPPEEDESLAKKTEYSFNPLQAQKEMQIGKFYFKKGSYKAAAERFREATKWNAGLAEAWLHLGETEEKQHDSKAAREAYAKYLELDPEAKNAGEIRKKLNKK